MEGDDNLPSGNFSDAERLALRRLLRDLDRGTWLKKQAIRWSLWLLGVPVAIWTTWQAIEQAVNGVAQLVRNTLRLP